MRNNGLQMSFADLSADDDAFSAFSAFNEVEPETPENDQDADEAPDAEEEKAEKPKKSAKKASAGKASKTVPAPVKVQGTGWSFSYGDEGQKCTVLEAVKAAYEAGFSELGNDAVRLKIFRSTVYVQLPEAATENLAMGDRITIALGQMKAEYVPSDFGGDAEGSEISVFDVQRRFWETHPEFTGVGLALDQQSHIAVPAFTDKAGKLEGEVSLYQDGEVRKIRGTKSEIEESLKCGAGKDVTVTLYSSDTGTIFPVYTAKTPAAISVSDIVSHDGKAKKTEVKEVFRLPARIYDNYHGESHDVTSDDFDGKPKVILKDIIDYLKRFHRKFSSTSKKFFAEQDGGTIYVSVASGTKG